MLSTLMLSLAIGCGGESVPQAEYAPVGPTARRCTAGTVVRKETCSNGMDDNCDGFVDNCSVDADTTGQVILGDGSASGTSWLGWNLGAGDLNGDGAAELVAQSYPSHTVIFDPLTADVTPVADADRAVSDAAAAIAVGDANGDGQADLVVAGLVFYGPITASTDASSADTIFYSAYAHAGEDVDIVSDHDGDGFPDIVLGTPTSVGRPARMEMGRVYVMSGLLSGAVDLQPEAMYTYSAFETYDELGLSVADAGDMTGDGIEELALGAPRHRGAVYIAEGGGFARHVNVAADALATLEPRRPDAFDYAFGVVDATDYDGDGYDDLFVGAATAPNLHDERTGVAYAFLGPLSGAIRPEDAYTCWDGVAVESYLGAKVAAGGDVDGDGNADVLFAAPGWYYSSTPAVSTVYVQRGATSGVHSVRELVSISTGVLDYLGASVTFIPDWDGDGADEVALGAPISGAYDSATRLTDGAVYVVSSSQL